MSARFASFGEFYPFHLSEHRDPTCRKLDLAGDWVMYWQLATGKIPFGKRHPGARRSADSA